MKKLILLGAFTAVLCLSACDDNRENDRVVVDEYNAYVDRVGADTAAWYTDNSYWTNTNRNYDSLNHQVQTRYEKMDEASRRRVDSVRTRYESYREQYARGVETRRVQQENNNTREQMRIALFGSDAATDLSNITAQNIASYYERLINTVQENQGTYSPAQWDAIKAWYEKLDARKNEVEKDLATKDNLRIAELKVKYNAIRVPGRVDSKVEEKMDEQGGNNNK